MNEWTGAWNLCSKQMQVVGKAMAQSKAISIIFITLTGLWPPILKNLACDVTDQNIIEQPFRLSMIAILYSLKNEYKMKNETGCKQK